MGEYLMGSPAPFFEAVEQQPAPAAGDGVYQATIDAVEVAGPVAAATLRETGYMGMNFTDFFHLAQIDGQWRITSKTFNPETAS